MTQISVVVTTGQRCISYKNARHVFTSNPYIVARKYNILYRTEVKFIDACRVKLWK